MYLVIAVGLPSPDDLQQVISDNLNSILPAFKLRPGYHIDEAGAWYPPADVCVIADYHISFYLITDWFEYQTKVPAKITNVVYIFHGEEFLTYDIDAVMARDIKPWRSEASSAHSGDPHQLVNDMVFALGITNEIHLDTMQISSAGTMKLLAICSEDTAAFNFMYPRAVQVLELLRGKKDV